ncbi:hypothetical protein I309_04360 [Cryptococcus deuterogattii LA55]|nr:hypothetical protein I309_04360 [Cryptococcus deuterogattii LA55]KIR96032.1 hypothetical protein I304_00798 [Cryptococcus deuterogattii CBS 10090]
MAEELDDLSGFNDSQPLNPPKKQHFQAVPHWHVHLENTYPKPSVISVNSETRKSGCSPFCMTELKEKVRTGNGELERERARKKVRAETDQNVLNLVHAVVREMVQMPRHRPKPVYAAENWPDYYQEETPDGFFLQDGKIFWHPNWSTFALTFLCSFENLHVKGWERRHRALPRKMKIKIDWEPWRTPGLCGD